MSTASSENNYKIAKSLYQEISDNFYEIENNSEDDDEYLIDQTLDVIKRLNRHINRINMEELEDEYSDEIVDILDNNIDTYKEAGYFIERALMSMKLFDKIHPVLDQYIKKINWNSIANTQEEATTKFGRFLTNEDNFKQYKTIIGNIVKGTMQKKAFLNFFESIKNRISKPIVHKEKERQPLPPSMWSEEDQEKWQKMKDERKEEAKGSKEWEEKAPSFDDFSENFISLRDFKKLND